MKRRSESILRRFVANSRVQLSMPKLEEEFGVSERTLRNDLAEIGLFLRDLGMTGIYQNASGKLVVDETFDVRKVDAALRDISIRDYKLSPEERRIYIEIVLLWFDGYLTMQDMADELLVSRITILKDIEAIKDEMAGYHITVTSDVGKGVRISCTTDDRLAMLHALLQQLTVGDGDRSVFHRLVMKRLDVRHTFDEVYDLVRTYLSENTLTVIDERLYALVLFIFMLVNIDLGQEHLEIVDVSHEDRPNGLLEYVCQGVGCATTDEMLLAFGNYLGTNDVGSFVRRVDEVELYEVVVSFLSRIDAQLGTALSSDDVLISSLQSHLQDARDWGDLEFDFAQDDVDSINYESLEQAVDTTLPMLERYLAIQVNEGLKRSIILHMCVSLIRGAATSSKLKVLVTCPGSMATGRYLEAQLRNYFDFDIVGVVREANLASYLKQAPLAPDLIISTVPLSQTAFSYVVVHAVLTMQDMDLIRREAMRVLGPEHAVKLPPIPHTPAIPEVHVSAPSKASSSIGDLLKRENLQFNDEVSDWREAIAVAGQPLVDQGSIEPAYVQKAIENVETFGDYIVLRPGIALAHAGKNNGVNRDALGLLISHPGVTFSNQQSVNFLFFLALQSDYDPADLFAEILAIDDEPGARGKLLSLSEDALYAYLCAH